MKSTTTSKENDTLQNGSHKKATYTLPPDVLTAIDKNWRFHETLDSGLADSKSEYVADVIRRDTAQKHGAKSKSPR